ncbi:MAG: hypothetical protein OEY06_12925 [Gammaproteobacteria bacterium]|nr:hypothetical protein [Gammaproteobacteria bacterium]
MSLLLDALKKAEQDKQKARQAEETVTENGAQLSEPEVVADELIVQAPSEQLESVNKDDLKELELTIDGTSEEKEELELPDSVPELAKPVDSALPGLERNAATNFTVSDEALQLLIHKTNKKYYQTQRAIWGGLLSVAVIILIMTGTYYYLGMLEEVDSLERKHKLAMRSVQMEVSESGQAALAIESPKSAEVIQASQNNVKQKQAVVQKSFVRADKPSVKVSEVRREFSIKKTNAEDPINSLLREAWLAYNKADYSTASGAYEKVLKREARNRDALLGMAAVAVKLADYEKAKASYQLLIKLDPRDQVAVSAMTNLDKLSASSQDESKLKFMLQQQPTATHLNFALGNYYATKGKWPEAQAEYFKAWQGNSDNADYIYNLAVSLDQLGKSNQALRFYKESLVYANNKNISFSKSEVEKRIERISDK